jgi:serine/threonine protein kinase
MALTLEQFGKAVVAAGLAEPTELKAVWNSLAADARPKTGEQLAKILVDQGKITGFQAQEVLNGRGNQLQIGQYNIIDKIGAGGMGTVYRAQHKLMKRIVAIKVLSADRVKNETAIKRFKREAEAAARMSHPNIVQSYDSGEQEGKHYLVMEYVEGVNLSRFVKQQGPRPVDEAVSYVAQAAHGLAYAHKQGVFHRDIKPGNLLLDKTGVVKILDMGLARFDDADPAAGEKLTMAGEVMGTSDYMAPEQWLDLHIADARSDIYSLGCTLYRLLVGESPYVGDTVMQKLMAHTEAPIPKLRDKRPDVPELLEAIYQKTMAKKPDDRYQDAELLAYDLENYKTPGAQLQVALEVEPVKPITSSKTASPKAKQRAGAAENTSSSITAKPTKSPAKQAAKSWYMRPGVIITAAAVLLIVLGGAILFKTLAN